MRLHPAIHKITKNDYVFTIFTKVAAVLIGVIASSFHSRYLGPALKGEVSSITAVLSVVAIVAGLGLYQPYPFYKRNGEPDVLKKFLNLYMAQFLCYTVLGVVLAVVLRTPALVAVCLITPVQVLANQLSSMIMAEDVKYKNVIFFSARVTNTVLAVLTFFLMRPMLWVALGMIVMGDLITVALTLRRLRIFPNPFRAEPAFLKKILGFGFVAMLTTLLILLNYKVDVIMMPWFGVTNAQIGFYSTGAGLAEYGWLIPEAFREVLFSRASKGDTVQETTRMLKINFYLTLLMIAGIILLGRPVIWMLYGTEYLPSYQVTVILVTGILSMAYFKIIGTLLMAHGKRNTYFLLLLFSVVTNIAVNCLTIPKWGIEGAAFASVLSYTVAGVAFLAYFVRTYDVRVRDLFRISREDLAILTRFRRKGSDAQV